MSASITSPPARTDFGFATRSDEGAHRKFPAGYNKPADWMQNTLPGVASHTSNVRVLRCSVSIGCGAYVTAYTSTAMPHAIFVQPGQPGQPGHHRNPDTWNEWGCKIEDVDPFISVEVLSGAYTKEIQKRARRRGLGHMSHWNTFRDYEDVMVTETDTYSTREWYDHTSHQYHAETHPWYYLQIKVTAVADGVSEETEFRFPRPNTGTLDVDGASIMTIPVSTTFFSTPISWMVEVASFESLMMHLGEAYTVKQGKDALWSLFFDHHQVGSNPVPDAGVKAFTTRKAIKANLTRLAAEEPVLHRFFLWLHDAKTTDKTSNNKLIAAMLQKVGEDYDALRSALRNTMVGAPTAKIKTRSYKAPKNRHICHTLPGAQEREEDRKAKDEWAFRKTAKAKAEGLGVSAVDHPRLMAAIEAGKIPFGVFHEPGKEMHLLNVEFDLWEEALGRPEWNGILHDIAQNAAGRGTYSRLVTSYIAFLFKIEEYLNRHAPRPKTGKKTVSWKAMPKFVRSQWELEMAEATEEGTTKKRSALTPVADNDTGVITVPYVAMAVRGQVTTWCYSDRYYLVERGLNDPLGSGVFSRDLVEKLNGRDDYGLCFYTLTGTSRNEGYPTFLIILERTTKHGTRVHFHRVHPCRSHNGVPTPACRLIEDCYRYMAGNIKAEDIAYQQGDLLLVRTDAPGNAVDADVPVYGFENHAFTPVTHGDAPVRLFKATGKSRGNLLGWLYSASPFKMPHPEHESIEYIPAGYYALRRAKSWEANPTSVWVLNID